MSDVKEMKDRLFLKRKNGLSGADNEAVQSFTDGYKEFLGAAKTERLAAKVADSDKIMGLTIGADDYITKPFNPLEVVARIKTQLRRYRKYNSGEQPTAQEYDIRGLTINRESHRCVLYGNELQLTPIEFSILWYLCERKGKVVPSEELFEAVWKEKYMNSNNTVMAHIARLREKMHEPARSPKFIKTVWGVGYTIE